MRLPKAALLFLVPIVLARFVNIVLSSRPGRKLADKAGQAELATEKGIDLAGDYAGKVAAVMTVAAASVQDKVVRLGSEPKRERTSWSQIAHDTADLLLATGGVLKVVAEFVEDKEELARRPDVQAQVGMNRAR